MDNLEFYFSSKKNTIELMDAIRHLIAQLQDGISNVTILPTKRDQLDPSNGLEVM